MMRVLDLFSGIGGFSLGLEKAGMQTIAFCETDDYCQRVLAKHWPGIPIYGDIRELDGTGIACDVISGGFPCQPFSVAGKQRGKEDDRHLWPEMLRVIAQARPAWVIGENVPGIIRMELDTVLSDLEGLGYTTRTFVIPACAVDAPHRRDRVWVIARADAISAGLHQRELLGGIQGEEDAEDWRETAIVDSETRGTSPMADAECWGRQGSRESIYASDSTEAKIGEATEFVDGGEHRVWGPEPGVGRVANGIPARVDRLRALGNAIVPQIAEIIGKAIMAANAERQAVV